MLQCVAVKGRTTQTTKRKAMKANIHSNGVGPFIDNAASPQKRNMKKNISDFNYLADYGRSRVGPYFEDFARELNATEAREAFKFCKDYELADKYTQLSLKVGYDDAKKVLDKFIIECEMQKEKMEESQAKEHQDRLKASDSSKEIWATKIAPMFDEISKELEELHKMDGFRSYMIQDEFERKVNKLSTAAKIMRKPRY